MCFGDIPRLFGTPFALDLFDLRCEFRSRMLGSWRTTSVVRFAKKTSRASSVFASSGRCSSGSTRWVASATRPAIAFFMDQCCSSVLLFLFNPCIRSLRALQQASELKNVQQTLGCGRSSLGSLSEATNVFDPERLRQIIGEMAAEVKPSRNRSDDFVKHVVTAMDDSIVETLSTIAEAACLKTKNGDSRSVWRLHTHFEVDRGFPTRIDVTSGKNGEKNVLRAH